MPRLSWSDGDSLSPESLSAFIASSLGTSGAAPLPLAAPFSRLRTSHLAAIVASADAPDALAASRSSRAILVENAGVLLEVWRADGCRTDAGRRTLAAFDVIFPVVAEAAGAATTQLDLSDISLTLAGPMPSLSMLPNLRCIDLSRSAILPEGLVAVANAYPRLQCLAVAGCVALSKSLLVNELRTQWVDSVAHLRHLIALDVRLPGFGLRHARALGPVASQLSSLLLPPKLVADLTARQTATAGAIADEAELATMRFEELSKQCKLQGVAPLDGARRHRPTADLIRDIVVMAERRRFDAALAELSSRSTLASHIAVSEAAAAAAAATVAATLSTERSETESRDAVAAAAHFQAQAVATRAALGVHSNAASKAAAATTVSSPGRGIGELIASRAAAAAATAAGQVSIHQRSPGVPNILGGASTFLSSPPALQHREPFEFNSTPLAAVVNKSSESPADAVMPSSFGLAATPPGTLLSPLESDTYGNAAATAAGHSAATVINQWEHGGAPSSETSEAVPHARDVLLLQQQQCELRSSDGAEATASGASGEHHGVHDERRRAPADTSGDLDIGTLPAAAPSPRADRSGAHALYGRSRSRIAAIADADVTGSGSLPLKRRRLSLTSPPAVTHFEPVAPCIDSSGSSGLAATDARAIASEACESPIRVGGAADSGDAAVLALENLPSVSVLETAVAAGVLTSTLGSQTGGALAVSSHFEPALPAPRDEPARGLPPPRMSASEAVARFALQQRRQSSGSDVTRQVPLSERRTSAPATGVPALQLSALRPADGVATFGAPGNSTGPTLPPKQPLYDAQRAAQRTAPAPRLPSVLAVARPVVGRAIMSRRGLVAARSGGVGSGASATRTPGTMGRSFANARASQHAAADARSPGVTPRDAMLRFRSAALQSVPSSTKARRQLEVGLEILHVGAERNARVPSAVAADLTIDTRGLPVHDGDDNKRADIAGVDASIATSTSAAAVSSVMRRSAARGNALSPPVTGPRQGLPSSPMALLAPASPSNDHHRAVRALDFSVGVDHIPSAEGLNMENGTGTPAFLMPLPLVELPVRPQWHASESQASGKPLLQHGTHAADASEELGASAPNDVGGDDALLMRRRLQQSRSRRMSGLQPVDSSITDCAAAAVAQVPSSPSPMAWLSSATRRRLEHPSLSEPAVMPQKTRGDGAERPALQVLPVVPRESDVAQIQRPPAATPNAVVLVRPSAVGSTALYMSQAQRRRAPISTLGGTVTLTPIGSRLGGAGRVIADASTSAAADAAVTVEMSRVERALESLRSEAVNIAATTQGASISSSAGPFAPLQLSSEEAAAVCGSSSSQIHRKLGYFELQRAQYFCLRRLLPEWLGRLDSVGGARTASATYSRLLDIYRTSKKSLAALRTMPAARAEQAASQPLIS